MSEISMVFWDEFEAKHGNRLEKEFENLTYHLFCYEYNNGKGIHRYHNQKALETDPIKYNDECIGFQTKVYDTPLSKNKGELKKCIKKANEVYPKLTTIVFYIYKEFGQSSNENQNKPDYIKEIEDYGRERCIKVIWKVRSELERMLQEPENILLYYIFFKGDFNGIQTLESFIKKSENKFRPDLKNNYLKIDTIHDELIKKIRDNRITVISGKQTIGKTRLSIEVAKQLSDEDNAHVIIINYPDYNLIVNLKKIIRPDEKYLIIFDNYTHNFPDLHHIINELWNYGKDINNIKFIFTLKNQYSTILKEELNEFGVEDFPLDTISDNEMRIIIKKSSIDYGLTLTHTTTNGIIDRSKGNVGICLMALRLIKEESFNSIETYEDIYKSYFDNLKLNRLSRKSKQILGILSFFESIDLKNTNLINKINETFGYNLLEELHLIEEFSNDEIIDWNYNSIYFSDSILSTYIFYLTFVNEELLSLHDLIINFIEKYNYILINRIYDVFSIFGKNSIENLKITQLNPIKNELEGNNLDLFYIIFYIIYVDEITAYLIDWIESFEEDSKFNRDDFKIPDKFRHLSRMNKLTLLSRLFYTENQIYGLKLTVELILKRQTLTGNILYSLKENYSYKLSSIENDFNMQNNFLDFIESDFDADRQVIVDNIYLFLLSENRFFSLKHAQNRQTTKPYESEILEIEIPYSKSWMNLRCRLLRNLFKLYEEYPIKVGDIFEDYTSNIYKDFNLIYENEEEIVFNFLNKLDYKKYKANKIAYIYLKEMDENNVDLKNNYDFIDEDIIESISTYSNILNPLSYPEYSEIVESINVNLKKNNYDYKYAFNLMKDIKTREEGCNVYCDHVFFTLLGLDFNMFVEAYKYYMQIDFGLITSYGFLSRLVDYENENLDCYNLINCFNYSEQNDVNSDYFQYLPENCVNETIFNHFIDFIKKSPSNINFSSMERYLKFDKIFQELINTEESNIIQYIIKTTLPNITEKTQINIHQFCEDNLKYFEDNMELLERFYLKNISIKNYDHDFTELKILCENNNEFLFKYFDCRLKYNDEFFKEHEKITFIWGLNYEFEEIENLINKINDNYDYIEHEPVNLLFANINQKEKRFIEYYIKNNANNDKYMRVIFKIIKFNYSTEEYLEFLEEFLIINDNLGTFKLLMAPYFLRDLYYEKTFLENQIKFFEQIKERISQMDDSLKYIKHKLYLNDKIEEVQEKMRKKYYL